jgi:hypothetical protein
MTGLQIVCLILSQPVIFLTGYLCGRWLHRKAFVLGGFSKHGAGLRENEIPVILKRGRSTYEPPNAGMTED